MVPPYVRVMLRLHRALKGMRVHRALKGMRENIGLHGGYTGVHRGHKQVCKDL